MKQLGTHTHSRGLRGRWVKGTWQLGWTPDPQALEGDPSWTPPKAPPRVCGRRRGLVCQGLEGMSPERRDASPEPRPGGGPRAPGEVQGLGRGAGEGTAPSGPPGGPELAAECGCGHRSHSGGGGRCLRDPNAAPLGRGGPPPAPAWLHLALCPLLPGHTYNIEYRPLSLALSSLLSTRLYIFIQGDKTPSFFSQCKWGWVGPVSLAPAPGSPEERAGWG